MDFPNKEEVIINMTEYVKEMLEDFKEFMDDKISKTPAGDWLFEVRKNGIKLNENKKQLFHTMTAKALFLCKQARPDIMTTVAFLTTRVREPDEDD